jgi:hypothetical protein
MTARDLAALAAIALGAALLGLGIISLAIGG